MFSGRTVFNSFLTVSVNTKSLLAMKREYWHKQLATGSLNSKSVGQAISSTIEKMVKTAEKEGGQLYEGGQRGHVRFKTL